MNSTLKLALAATAALLSISATSAQPITRGFVSAGVDRAAIDRLLDTYTRAVSTKDQALFETLLLDRDIPFSGVAAATRNGAAAVNVRNYEGFRRGVFEGAPFTQRFRDVHVEQDGDLAQVSLVFVNTDARGSSWGWKTLQLLKVGGSWKIASEFYTNHAGTSAR